MSEITYERTLRASPEALWPWLVEPDKLAQWLPNVETFRYEGASTPGVGSRFLMEVKEGRRVTPYQGEILALEKPRRLSLRMVGGCGPKPFTIDVDYKLSNLGRETRVDYVCRCVMPEGFFWRIMGAIGRFFMKAMLKKTFDRLAARVEKT
jgi:uncharacterized protein YndB with AHSA1/START domain